MNSQPTNKNFSTKKEDLLPPKNGFISTTKQNLANDGKARVTPGFISNKNLVRKSS